MNGRREGGRLHGLGGRDGRTEHGVHLSHPLPDAPGDEALLHARSDVASRARVAAPRVGAVVHDEERLRQSGGADPHRPSCVSLPSVQHEVLRAHAPKKAPGMPRARSTGGSSNGAAHTTPSNAPAWASTPVPATPKARNAYLDLCTQHLIAPDVVDPFPVAPAPPPMGGDEYEADASSRPSGVARAWTATVRTAWPPAVAGEERSACLPLTPSLRARIVATAPAVLARTPCEWRTHAGLACVVCGDVRVRERAGGAFPGMQSLAANPFASRCLVAVCETCDRVRRRA